MKIGQQPDISPAAVQSAQPAATKAAGQGAAAAVKNDRKAPGEGVTVSTLARTLESASQGETADVDAKKVNSVRSAIQQGTYVVNAEAIAVPEEKVEGLATLKH